MSDDAPEWLAAFDTRSERFVHKETEWSLVLPRSSEDLFDAAAFEADERLPYWADLWPSAKALARWVLDGNAPEREAIEIGSGVALVSLALQACGVRVLATDYEESALRFAAENARRNGLGQLETARFDWRDTKRPAPAPLVIGADVLYEARNAVAIADLLPRIVAPGGRAVLADPRRPWRGKFHERLHRAGWTLSERPLGSEPGPSGTAVEIVLIECRNGIRS
jgi:predicted nicotinamide N-methyase